MWRLSARDDDNRHERRYEEVYLPRQLLDLVVGHSLGALLGRLVRRNGLRQGGLQCLELARELGNVGFCPHNTVIPQKYDNNCSQKSRTGGGKGAPGLLGDLGSF